MDCMIHGPVCHSTQQQQTHTAGRHTQQAEGMESIQEVESLDENTNKYINK